MRPSLALAAFLAAAVFDAWAMPGNPSARVPTLSGTVMEVRDVGGYTYLRLKTKQEGEIWSAIAKSEVKKGAEVTIVPDTVMENFESKALGRKFDRIVFASLAGPEQPGANPHAKSVRPAAKVARVARAEAADARTVEEVVAGRSSLKDKAVTIRAQVVKVTGGVLGKNWVHLQDGSGSAAKGTHDLLVTTTDDVAVGDVVVARGTVRTDVVVGPGYSYDVLVEGTKLGKS